MWLSKLMGYNYEISHRKSSENVTNDALSRVQGSKFLTLVVLSIEPALLANATSSWKDDLDIQ